MGYSLQDDIKQKKNKVRELSAVISVWANKPVVSAVKAKEQELRDRLSYTLLDLERQGLNAKIKSMEKLISILKS